MVYHARIAELHNLQIKSYRTLEKPLNLKEARETCSTLAHLADAKQLAALAVPRMGQGFSEQQVEATEAKLTDTELAALAHTGNSLYSDPDAVYQLRLKENNSPVRFASFFTGGTCASYQVFNLQWLVSSQGLDSGREEVDDPEEEIRWAYWGGGDYPIVYRGRYFMVTADLANLNRANMISWIKPNGKVRPLCLLKIQGTKRIVHSAKDRKLCSGVANGTILAVTGKDVTEVLPLNHNPGQYRDEFVARYGDYADTVQLLKIDLDRDGMPENIGRFEYASGAGCGSTRVWLRVLSKTLDSVINGPLNDLLAQVSSGSKQIYKFQGRYYIDGSTEGSTDGVVQIRGGRVNQICEFDEKTQTQTQRFFTPSN
jgi:hypothetical protein